MGDLCGFFCSSCGKRVLRYRESFVKTTKLRSLRLSLSLVFMITTLLHRAGDVEKNPGPGPRLHSSGSRQPKSAGGRRSSTDGETLRTSDDVQQKPTMTDIMTMLSGLRGDFQQRMDTMDGHFDVLHDCLSGLKQQVNELSDEVETLKSENDQLRTENRGLAERLEEAEKKLDDLEGRSKRNNLIFSGLKKEKQNESYEDCEKTCERSFA